ncbi:MAG: CHAD domain-containing protein, partial [Planctomycetota bacterium]
MAFEFRLGEPVQREFRRIATERAESAIRAIQRSEATGVAPAVHEARRRCKQIRALLRLVRPSFGKYEAENAAVRDAARSLADLRDAQSIVDAFDRLLIASDLRPDRFETIRETLAEHHSRTARSAEQVLAGF